MIKCILETLDGLKAEIALKAYDYEKHEAAEFIIRTCAIYPFTETISPTRPCRTYRLVSLEVNPQDMTPVRLICREEPQKQP